MLQHQRILEFSSSSSSRSRNCRAIQRSE